MIDGRDNYSSEEPGLSTFSGQLSVTLLLGHDDLSSTITRR